ncbi:hypothetical protein Hanom_Chr10g00933341 [Helianthus anomalus]
MLTPTTGGLLRAPAGLPLPLASLTPLTLSLCDLICEDERGLRDAGVCLVCFTSEISNNIRIDEVLCVDMYRFEREGESRQGLCDFDLSVFEFC